jgi:hypothetical protein
MPGVRLLREKDSVKDDHAKLPVYKICLYLPSQIGRRVDVSDELREVEWKLRVAHAAEALEGVRAGIRLRAFLEKRHREGVQGVAAGTRAQNALRSCKKRIEALARRYRVAVKCLHALAKPLKKGIEWQYRFQPLTDDDLKPLPLGAATGDGTAELSWIWTSRGLAPDDKDALEDGE